MSSTLKWYQPRGVAEWEWANGTLPELKNFNRLLRRWMLALGGPTLLGVAIWAPDHFVRIACGMVGFLAYTLVFYLQGKVRLWAGSHYELDARGLRGYGPGAAGRHRWKDVESHRFSDHPDVPNIRRLEFKPRQSERWRSWSFDPAKVDESALRAILCEHLPTPIDRRYPGMILASFDSHANPRFAPIQG
jgi:hypothetical protein